MNCHCGRTMSSNPDSAGMVLCPGCGHYAIYDGPPSKPLTEESLVNAVENLEEAERGITDNIPLDKSKTIVVDVPPDEYKSKKSAKKKSKSKGKK